MTFSRHILIELYDCNRYLLDKILSVEEILREMVKDIGVEIEGMLSRQLKPGGVSVILDINESHIDIRTFPKEGYACIDILTIGNLDPTKGFKDLKRKFQASSFRIISIERGLREDYKDIIINGVKRVPIFDLTDRSFDASTM